MALPLGRPVPWFTAPTPSNPEFVFDTAAGRYVLMLFLPQEAAARGAALQALAAHQAMFDDVRASAFVVFRDAGFGRGLKDLRGLRWMFDGGPITERYGPEPHWLLLDPTLRVLASAPIDEAEAIFR